MRKEQAMWTVGQKLLWTPANTFDPQQEVEVVGLRRHGVAILSNGWAIDEDGVALGTGRNPGGSVEPIRSAQTADAPLGQ
jgi:hypothetical protein